MQKKSKLFKSVPPFGGIKQPMSTTTTMTSSEEENYNQNKICIFNFVNKFNVINLKYQLYYFYLEITFFQMSP